MPAPKNPKKKPVKKAQVKKVEEGELLYPEFDVKVFARVPESVGSLWKDTVPMTADIAKEILGWQELPDNAKEYLLTDVNGKKIRCVHNEDNRPFYRQLADDWMLEILRQKWKMNAETIKVDRLGKVHDGQHRLIGLILSVQTWLKDQEKAETERKWQQFWTEEPCIDALVALGIDPDSADTIGTGKRRDERDVLYRSAFIRDLDLPQGVRLNVTKIANNAVKTLWLRTAQSEVSFAPRRPHSEYLDFIKEHPKIIQCAKFIYDEGEGNKLSDLIPLGYAAGLLYLMGSATTDRDDYLKDNSEASIKWDLWEEACEFWVDLSNNGKKTEAVREKLLNIPVEAQGSFARDLRIGYLIKGWNLYSDGEVITLDSVELEVTTNSFGQSELAESPKLGGIDCV